MTITIKPEILRFLRHDSWETNSVFIVDLNATIRRVYTNLKERHQETDSSVLQLRGNRTYYNKLSVQRKNTVLGMRTHGP